VAPLHPTLTATGCGKKSADTGVEAFATPLASPVGRGRGGGGAEVEGVESASKSFHAMRRLSSITYGHMVSMPRLPVPPLAQTCELYLHSIRPLATPEQLATSASLVADFQREGGVGQRLHSLLVQRAAREHNWLERWWDNSYLDTRAYFTVTSACFVVCKGAREKRGGRGWLAPRTKTVARRQQGPFPSLWRVAAMQAIRTP
jgi:hypothetical protein